MVSPGERGSWGSRMGFILAAAGSAVGLGNIWGFPTQVGQGGGAAFVLVYFVCVACICGPILVAELAIGRRAQQSPVAAFAAIRPGTQWWLTGALGVLAGAGILSFYAVVAGWTLGYVWFSATGEVHGGDAFFGAFVRNIPLTLGLTGLVLGITATVVASGVHGGIERFSKTLMPLLVGLLVLLAIRGLTLPGASEGLSYYLRPDFSRIADVSVFNAALGQAFFSLSLGMGTMITYGSYLSRRETIASAALWVILLDTSIALLAGLIIFPTGFSIAGFDPATGGPGLIFSVLPRLFETLPGGSLFGVAFFLLLAVAALTSAVSLLEVPVAYLIDSHGWSRGRAVAVTTAFTGLLAMPSALGNGAVAFFTSLPGLGIDFLTLMATVWNNFALPIGGLLVSLFVGYAWRVNGAVAELRAEGAWFPLPGLWAFLIRYVSPAGILLIIVFTIRALLGA
jgi:neurotransmitter:Na+ symporter, NSS family